jgi:hypothetical protein
MTDTSGEIRDLIDAVPSNRRRADAETLLELYGRITGEPARLWPGNIVGFGSYHYTYASGREGDAAAAGFSPRKAAMTLYIGHGFDDYADELAELGEHTTSVGCLYIKDLGKVNIGVLERIVANAYRTMSQGVYQ